MNSILLVSRLSISAIGGLIISLLLTLAAWNIQIEHRAFHCTDDVGFGFFWENMDTHERANDFLPLAGLGKSSEKHRRSMSSHSSPFG